MHDNTSLGNILIVDDDSAIVSLLSENLNSEGYSVRVIDSTATVEVEDLLDVHLMLIDGAGQLPTGLELISQLKTTPVGERVGMIYYSEYDDESTLIDALDAGADDCVRKPFSLREFLARIRSVIRRRIRLLPTEEFTTLQYKGLVISLLNHEASFNDRPLLLTKTEINILEMLLRNRNGYTSRADILQTIWHDNADVNERTVDTNISRLRRKLSEMGVGIENRTGQGYRITFEQ